MWRRKNYESENGESDNKEEWEDPTAKPLGITVSTKYKSLQSNGL